MTERLYLQDPYLVTFEAMIQTCFPLEGNFGVILDRTAYCPRNQEHLGDDGLLEYQPVLDLFEDAEGRIVHVLSEHLEGKVKGFLDWPRRFDNMQNHSGQHLLSQAILRILSVLPTIHMTDAGECYLHIKQEHIQEKDIIAIENMANEWLAQGLPIHYMPVEQAKYSDANLLLRPQPQSYENCSHIVRIGEIDNALCSGVHCRETSKIGIILVKKWVPVQDGYHIFFACGRQALRYYQSLRTR